LSRGDITLTAAQPLPRCDDASGLVAAVVGHLRASP
jgi:hypothetical protein